MFDESDARKLAQAKVGPEVELGAARELREGWFFPRREIGSHGVIVNKRTGRAFALGSAFPVERDLALYDLGYQFERYDLVITAIHDLDAARRSIGRLPLTLVEPVYENGEVWRVPKPMTDLERWRRLDKLPCIFPAISLYFHIEVLEDARRDGAYDFVALEYRPEPATT